MVVKIKQIEMQRVHRFFEVGESRSRVDKGIMIFSIFGL